MIADNFRQTRQEVEAAVEELLRLNAELDPQVVTPDILPGLLARAREPLSLVAIGGAKTGKSSLLRALLGERVPSRDIKVAEISSDTPQDRAY